MPKQKLRLKSVTFLLAYLRGAPQLKFSLRNHLSRIREGERVYFVGEKNGQVKFRDAQQRPVLMDLREDYRGLEWGIRFFPGGWRFRRGHLVMTFKFDNSF